MVDELTKEERDNIDSYLKRTVTQGSLAGLFFLEVPQDILGEAQIGHAECAPFCFAIELEGECLKFELLVRSKTNMHCTCIAHATPAQRNYVLQFADTLLEEEHIRS